MKYKQTRTREMEETILETVLKNRKIKSIGDYLKTGSEHGLDYTLLDNFDVVQREVEELMMNNAKLGGVVDCDVDGFTSMAVWVQYIRSLREDVDFKLFFHSGKQHGLTAEIMEQIAESGIDALFVLDAGSGDILEHEALATKGIKVFVFDHHEVEEKSDHAVVVNNQTSEGYDNKALSGVGVTYRMCQALDQWIGTCEADKFLDLVALGNIADGMNLHNLDTRYLVQQGLNNINNTLMNCIIQKQSFVMNGRVNITTVGWNVAPMLNAVIRVGSMEDKMMLFNGFLSDDVDYCMEVVAMCQRVQRQQNNNVKKNVPVIEKLIEEQGMAQENVIMVDVTGILDRTLVGLVANKLLSAYKRPIILLQERNEETEVLAGSVRVPRDVKYFKNTCSSLNLFNFCEGHQNAFGCSVDKDKVETVKELLNTKLEGIQIDPEPTHQVDAIIPYGALKDKDILEIGQLADLWGNGINEPLFVIKGIKMDSREIGLVGKNNTIRFEKGSFTFVKFFTNRDAWETMCCRDGDDFEMPKSIVMDIVCKFKANEWMGRTKPQLEIVDFESAVDEYDFF